MDDLIKKLREIADTLELTSTSKTVAPHAELKAMYEQQVKDGTVDDFVWEYKRTEKNEEFSLIQIGLGKFYSDCEYRCTSKPTCQVRNLDTDELKTMTREAAKLLQAELGDTVEWFTALNMMSATNDNFSFCQEGIYTYKLKGTVKLAIDDEPAKMLTQESLKELLNYDPDTGVFTWLKPAAYRTKVGEIAGSDHSKGYRVIQLFGKSQKSHRLAWLYMTGAFPNSQIDHINGIKNDNRWLNLREATNAQNQWNKPKSPKNTSGFKGVSWCKVKQKWLVQARLNGKGKHIGYFEDVDMAFAAYGKWISAFHGDFANNGLASGYGYPEQKGGC